MTLLTVTDHTCLCLVCSDWLQHHMNRVCDVIAAGPAGYTKAAVVALEVWGVGKVIFLFYNRSSLYIIFLKFLKQAVNLWQKYKIVTLHSIVSFNVLAIHHYCTLCITNYLISINLSYLSFLFCKMNYYLYISVVYRFC